MTPLNFRVTAMNSQPSPLLASLGLTLSVAAISCGTAQVPPKAPPQKDAPQEPPAQPVASSANAPASAASPASTGSPAADAPTTPSTAAAPMTAAPIEPKPRCPSGMVLVTGGEFKKGTQTVLVSDLCVDQLETTVEEYEKCATSGQCTTDGLDCSAQATYKKEGKEQHPVVCVEFKQATAYCSHLGKRLPTTDEWEWVASGGEEARTYPWGNEPPADQLCWTGKKRQTESCPVNQHAGDTTKDGVKDMGGNVLEFATTDADAHSPVRIAKGGAWNGGDAALFTNARLGGFKLEYRCGFLGIRCFQEAAPAP